jgi:hypothetical protein
MAKTVTLVDREGREHAVSSPLVLNQLHFGFGYRLPEGLSIDDAIAQLGEPEPAPVAPTAAEPAPTAAEARPRGRKETSGTNAEDSNTD